LKKLSKTDTIKTNLESSPKIIHETFSLNEIPSNYKTFDLGKRSRQYLSSDSSYESSTNHQSYPFSIIKSKSQQIHSTSSDSDDIDIELSNPITSSFEYSLIELFRIELIYKLYYLIDDNQLIFEIIRITPIQLLIEQYFSSFICKIRLFINNDKYKTKKYFSKKNPINELFKFDLEKFNLEKSYLKLHLLGYHQDNKCLELGQTVLVINQYNHLMIKSEQYTKFIQIYEDRIDMIIRQQVRLEFIFFFFELFIYFLFKAKNENEARALICLVYENDRCLLHVGLVKILGIQYLLKQPISHFHHRGI
jgi:hypothetical protein